MKSAQRLLTFAVMLLVIVAATCHNQAIAREKTMLAAVQTSTGARDFDFLVGSWQVLNRRLKVRHAGSLDWDEFQGRSTMRPILAGIGNVDEIHFPTKGFSGASLRFFNPESGQWTIFWVNSLNGMLQAPVTGSFHDGVGTFYGRDLDDGRPVKVRYTWSRITRDTARWEQAFSTDNGRTWETNWVMDFLRLR